METVKPASRRKHSPQCLACPSDALSGVWLVPQTLSLGLLTLEEWHFDSYTKKLGNLNKQGVWNVRITYCFRSGNWAVSESCCQDLFALARFQGQFCSFPLIMRSLTLLKILFLISDGQHQFLFLVTKHHVWHIGWLHIIPGSLEKYWYLQVVLGVGLL